MAKTEVQLTGSRDKSSHELKAEIEQTRAHMDRTVDDLIDQLHPRHVINDVLSRFRSGDGSSGIGASAKNAAMSAGRWIAREIGRHPLPSAVIGAGVAWLVMEEKRERTRPKELQFQQSCEAEYEPQQISGVNVMSESGFEKSTSPGLHDEMAPPLETSREFSEEESLSSTASGRIEEGKHKVSEAAARARAKASQTAEKVSEWSRQKWEQISHRGERARGEIGEQASGVRHGMRDRMDRMRSQLDLSKHRAAELIEEYPLVVGVSAMVVGVLVGLSVPSTGRERRIMGSKAARLREQAMETAEEIMERGKEVARATAEAAREEAERHGLTPEELKESAKEVARTAGAAAREHTEPMIGERADEPLEGSIGEQIRETLGEEIGREDEDDRVV